LTEPERPAANLAGTVLEGAYRLVALKGQGGMGAVYEAVQLRLNKRVAVKLMARELSSNQEALARFHREAEITSHLGHPHLVNVIDFGTAESGEPYLVMEYLEGEDLEQRLQRIGRLPVEAAVRILKQAASALGAAHAKEVVHRDLKPANIFLMQVPGEPDFVKVLDFGISKVKAARAKLTRATAVVGTPNYMSPEQAAGRVDETDHRADQWALACIAWEMLSGRTPFIADDVSPLFYQIANVEPEPLEKHAPGTPLEVGAVLRRALSKRPSDRFSNIREFSRAFEEAGLGRPADATPTPMTLSQVGLPRASSVDIARLSSDAMLAGGEGPAAERVPGGRITTFSHTTGEVTQHVVRSKFRPVHALALVAGIALGASGLLLLRPAAPPAAPPSRPVVVQPVASPTMVVPLPEPATEAPSVSPPAPVQPRARSAKGKAASEAAAVAPTENVSKRKVLKSKPKRRIFQEL
jgi:eukaryotic-like serine/threonine-protein kinase